jgi:membrane protease subunit HflK
MMQSVLGSSSKILVDQKAGSNLLYLPLDQLIRQSQAAPTGAEIGRPASAPDAAVTMEPSRGRELPRERGAGR